MQVSLPICHLPRLYISRGTGEHRPSKGQSSRGMAHPCIPEGPTDIFWLFGNIDTPHVNKSSISLVPRSSSGIHQTETTLNTAPILVHRDMKRQVGAILSHQTSPQVKLQPCALNHALALEGWRHCLEGVEHPFIIWMDHKNLTYLRTAMRLNPCQACWSLFFSRFNFSISYRPGSRNIKPDTLSHNIQHPPNHLPLASFHLGNRGGDLPSPSGTT